VRPVAQKATQRLTALATLVETAIASAFPAGDADQALGEDRLLESMHYSLRTPGKRLRPLLLLAAAEACGAQAEPLVGFATGIEMIHAYSLIHDDLPAMDDDDLRRGQPTNHLVYGEGMAILAGDGLLTEAFVRMLAPIETNGGCLDSARQARVVRDVACAAGYRGMVGGQAADLLAESLQPREGLLRSIHDRKTGALIRASVLGGAILAGAAEADVTALGQFAQHYGLAFQIADDVKDEIAPTEVSGKRVGGDRACGKMTYPALLGVQRSVEQCRWELDEAIAALAELGDRAGLLELLARDSVSFAVSRNEA